MYLRVGREYLDPLALVAEPLCDGADHVGVLRLGVGGHEEGEAVHHQDQRGHHVEVPRLRLLPLVLPTRATHLLSIRPGMDRSAWQQLSPESLRTH